MLYVIKMLYINLCEKQEDREFNRTKMKLSPKNFTHDSSLRNLEYNPHGLTAENNVWKAIRKKIYAVFYNVKRTVTCECWRVALSHKSFTFGISKLIQYFLLLLFFFMYHALHFPLCNFTLNFPCFTFFANGLTRKLTLLIKQFIFAFPSVSHTYKLQRLKMKSDIPLVTYTLNFKIVVFSLRSTLKKVLLKCRQVN